LACDCRAIDIRQLSLRQLPLSLLRQRADTMPEDSDANVVKIVVNKKGCIPLIIRQSMAKETTGLAIEQFPTAFGRLADDVYLSCDEMVEGGIERSQRLFVGYNGAQEILLVHIPVEGLRESGLIVLIARDPGYGFTDAGRAHLKRICDRQRRLLLK